MQSKAKQFQEYWEKVSNAKVTILNEEWVRVNDHSFTREICHVCDEYKSIKYGNAGVIDIATLTCRRCGVILPKEFRLYFKLLYKEI